MTFLQRVDPSLRRVMAHRALLARGLALLAFVCMAISAYGFRPQLESLAHYRPTPGPEDYYDAYAPWACLLGVLAVGGALWFSPRAAPVPRPPGRRLDRLAPGWAGLLLVPGLLALLLLAEANGHWIGLDELRTTSHHTQFALLITGVALLVLGLGGFARPDHDSLPSWAPETPAAPDDTQPRRPAVPDDMQPRHRLRQYAARLGALAARAARWELAWVLLVTLIALGVRLWALNDTVRIMVDEGHFALGVTYFWTFDDVKLLVPMPTSASFPFIFSYGEWASVQVLGRSFLGLRAFSAVLGALTVPALYLLAREIADRTTAAMAALVLLTFPPQLHYSRLALNNIADPLFGTLALALLIRGVRTRRRFDYVLAGASLGFTQYFYEGGRLMYPMLAVAWMAAGLVLWRLRPSLRGMMLAAAAFAVVAAPVYYTLIGQDLPVTDRLDKTEYTDYYWDKDREPDNFSTRVAHFHHSLMMYVNSPENTIFYYYLYYGGKHALILPLILPAFLLGIGIAAWRWRRPVVVLPGWVLLTSLGNAMLVESAVTARYVVVFPGLALLIALGIREGIRLVAQMSRWQAVQAGLALLLAAVIAVGQGWYYFGPFLDLFNLEVRHHIAYDVDDAILRSKDFPRGTEIMIVAEPPTLPAGDAQRLANFLADGLTVSILAPEDFRSVPLTGLRRDVPLAFFFAGDDTATLGRLEAAFGPRVVRGSPYRLPTGKGLTLYYVPAMPGAPAPAQAVG